MDPSQDRPSNGTSSGGAHHDDQPQGQPPSSSTPLNKKPVAEEFSDSSDDENMFREDQPDELYDEGADDADEKWVDKHLRKEVTRGGKVGGGQRQSPVLNCPCCFTTLCLDCQRHERYKTQFRAMFTVNCTVQKHTIMKASDGEEAHPVVCSFCGTQVGVFDKDEIYHFYEVLEA